MEHNMLWVRRSDWPTTTQGVVVAQDWAVAFYHSPAWLHNRKAYMETPIDTPFGIVPPGACERCYANGELKPAKVVHHITHLSPENIDDPHITLSFDNFQRLCQDCHAVVHSGQEPTRARFDSNGNLIREQA